MDAEIACAIVVHHGRVLMIRRTLAEGKFLWAFPSGEIEKGESPEQAAVRECQEELGIVVESDSQFASRVHPITQRMMRYVSARLAKSSPDPTVLDTAEIAEVRFVSPGDADDLSGNSIFEPVRAYIRSQIAE